MIIKLFFLIVIKQFAKHLYTHTKLSLLKYLRNNFPTTFYILFFLSYQYVRMYKNTNLHVPRNCDYDIFPALPII